MAGDENRKSAKLKGSSGVCEPMKIRNGNWCGRIFATTVAVVLFAFAPAATAAPAPQSTQSDDKVATPTIEPSKKETFWQKTELDPVSAYTLGLLVVAASQAALFLWQLRYMRKSVDDAAMSATAAREAALAGNRSNEISRATFEATERAFVFIDGFNTELTTRADALEPEGIQMRKTQGNDPDLQITRFAAQPRWKNGGNTPTRNMRIRTNWTHYTGPLPAQYYNDYGTDPTSFFIAPKAIEPSEFVEMSAAPQVLVDHQMRPVGSEPLVIIWGRADYEDVFGHPHFIEWCYRLRLERHDGKKMRAHFVQLGSYNRTDEAR
jgi:hypothetical protein